MLKGLDLPLKIVKKLLPQAEACGYLFRRLKPVIRFT